MKKLEAYHDEIKHCIRCGACQAVCPVFEVMEREMAVARGRLRLIREALEGKLDLTDKMRDYIDLCVGCRICVDNCPAKVNTDQIVIGARHKYVDVKGLPFLHRIMLEQILSKKGNFNMALKSLGLARGTRLNKLLPEQLKKKEEILPTIPQRTFVQKMKEMTFDTGAPKKVGFFLSCMDNFMFPEVVEAAIMVLQNNDWDIVIPSDVNCCGAPHHVYGDWETAAKLAKKNIEAFQDAEVDYIITDCATCGSVLKEYGEMLSGDSLKLKGKEFAAKIMDINAFLIDVVKIKPGQNKVSQTVTYHDPCHLVRHQKVSKQPREILLAVEGVEFRECNDADRCCGGAGTYNINHYDVSMKILDKKIENIKNTGADILATSCPACRIQLGYGMRRAGLNNTVVHPVELLARSYEQKD